MLADAGVVKPACSPWCCTRLGSLARPPPATRLRPLAPLLRCPHLIAALLVAVVVGPRLDPQRTAVADRSPSLYAGSEASCPAPLATLSARKQKQLTGALARDVVVGAPKSRPKPRLPQPSSANQPPQSSS